MPLAPPSSSPPGFGALCCPVSTISCDTAYSDSPAASKAIPEGRPGPHGADTRADRPSSHGPGPPRGLGEEELLSVSPHGRTGPVQERVIRISVGRDRRVRSSRCLSSPPTTVNVADVWRAVAAAAIGSIVELVVLGWICARRLDVGIGMRIAGTGAADRRMRLLSEWLAVGAWRIARIRALVVGIWPLGGIGGAHGCIECVMWAGVTRDVPGIVSRRLRKAAVDRLGNVRDDFWQIGSSSKRVGFRFGRIVLGGRTSTHQRALAAGTVA